jgi:HEAT repeat protein
MKPLFELEKLLQSQDEDTRRSAILALRGGPGGDERAAVIELLIRGMQDGSWRVRKTALDLLIEEYDHEEYIPSLIELLYMEDKAGARNTAAEGLVRLGHKSTPYLVEAFSTPNADVRKFIVDIIGEVDDRAAAQFLVRALSDEDENVKSSAVEHLGSIREPEVVDALIEILSGEDLWTAYPAAEALGKMGDDRAVPALIKVLDNAMLREPALRALGRLGDKNAIGKIVPFMNDRSQAVQHMAIYAMEEFYHRGIPEDAITKGILEGLGERAVPILIEQAASAREEIKASSILLLGLLKDDRALDPLLELAHEDEFAYDIRRALVFIGRENPESLLHFVSFKNTLMARFIVSVYAEVASPVYFDTLLQYLSSDDGHVRAWAARGLGRLGNPKAIDRLKAHLNDEFEDVQEAVVAAISRFKDSLSPPELQENLKSEDVDIRRNSVSLLGILDTDEALASICSAFGDQSPLVRRAALGALSTKHSETAFQYIQQALADEAPFIRMTAALILGETKEERFLEPVSLLLTDVDDKVRVSAAKALGQIGSGNAIERLMDALHDQNGFVVTSVIDAIGMIGGKEAQRALIRALSHKEKEVQRAALHALSLFSGSEDIILPFLEDPDWATRAVAAQSLCRTRNERVLREMEKALDRENDAVVRKALMGALGDR